MSCELVRDTVIMIDGVIVKSIKRHEDARGWLCEVFRQDELDPVHLPVMGYVSVTAPGVVRGPHEHREQTGLFAFLGPSDFKICLWDRRKASKTYGNYFEVIAGESNRSTVIVPPGVVHDYKNIGAVSGTVLNFANRLYRGKGGKGDIDEIRHEDDPHSGLVIE
jgi:dTDP-4-dehydrorhamnose 3,5-epimerase